jgi:peptidoglycan-N-acetylglucosamine deacetylase
VGIFATSFAKSFWMGLSPEFLTPIPWSQARWLAGILSGSAAAPADISCIVRARILQARQRTLNGRLTATARQITMTWVLVLLGIGIVALAHTAPAPFVLDAMAGSRAVWHMPRGDPPTVYLTYDDGPNPATTPDLLDVLKREGVSATFFVIDRHITEETAPIIRRMFEEGHAIALHSASKSDMLMSPSALAQTLTAAADHIEAIAGSRPCRAFRPRGGWRSSRMFKGLRQIDYELVGWGWMRWDVEVLRPRTADRIVAKFAGRARAGDIFVMHDGDESFPRKDQRQTVDATARLIPQLRARGFYFGTVCQVS